MNATSEPENGAARQGHLGADIHCASHAVRRALDAAIAARVSPELTGARGMVLGCIARCNRESTPVYQRDIEERFHIRRSSVTALLKAMEQDGFITRTPVERDARLKSLALTEKGWACAAQLARCIEGFEAALCAGLGPAELAQLQTALVCLVQNANALAKSAHAGA